jgi:hypothetical protein
MLRCLSPQGSMILLRFSAQPDQVIDQSRENLRKKAVLEQVFQIVRIGFCHLLTCVFHLLDHAD